jgi:LuxR family transcriptional regulator of spore coat protein
MSQTNPWPISSHCSSKEGWLDLAKQKGKPLLTNREREVFELLVQDKTTKEIAQQLFISEKTVRNHISNVMQKLNVKGRSQAVVELVRLGELEI